MNDQKISHVNLMVEVLADYFRTGWSSNLKFCQCAQNRFSDFWAKFGPYPIQGCQVRNYAKLWDTKAGYARAPSLRP